MASLLTHVNNTLRLIGEQPLLNTTGNLGDLCRQSLEEALVLVAQETRHTSFINLLSFTATNPDYLQPAFSLPSRCVQVLSLYYQATTTDPIRLVKLRSGSLESLATNYRFLVVGQQVFVGYVLTRPAALKLKCVLAPALPTLDTDLLSLEPEVDRVVEAVAASVLATSYLDDLGQASALAKRAQDLVARLRTRAGLTRDGFTNR